MPNSSIIPVVGRTQATPTLYNNVVKDAARGLMVAGAAKTIANGSITLTPANGEGYYAVDTEAAAASDFLDSINGGAAGDVVALASVSSARLIIVRSGLGNIVLKDSASIVLDMVAAVMLRYNGASWSPVGGLGGASVLKAQVFS